MMSILKKIWDFMSSKNFMALVGLAGFIFGIYQGFYYEKNRSLTISQSTFNRVFDVYQPVGGLEISYAGENLRTANKVLWTVNLTIVNSGETGIKIGDFDPKSPLGIEVKGGVIVDNPKFLASNNYIQSTLEKNITPHNIIFSPIILEPKDYININMLILGSENVQPKIKPLGVIAGIGRVQYVTLLAPIKNKSTWTSVIEAESKNIHLLRFITYGLGGFFLIAIAVVLLSMPLSALKDYINTRKREKLMSTYKENEDVSKEDKYLIDIYIKNGITPIRKIWELLYTINKYNKASEQLEAVADNDIKKFILDRMVPGKRNRMKNELEEREMVKFEGNKGNYDPNLETSLKELMNYLGFKDFNEKSSVMWNMFSDEGVYQSVQRIPSNKIRMHT